MAILIRCAEHHPANAPAKTTRLLLLQMGHYLITQSKANTSRLVGGVMPPPYDTS